MTKDLAKQGLTNFDLITHKTNMILSNCELIHAYNKKINSIEFS